MTIVVDAGPLYSRADRRDPDHAAVVEILLGTREPLVVPERAFRAVAPLQGGRFTLLPADA